MRNVISDKYDHAEIGLGTGMVYRYKTVFSYWTGPEKTDLKKFGGPDVGPIGK